MGTLLLIAGVVAFFAHRWGRRLAPLAKKALSWGDDLGGYTMFFAFGGARTVRRGITGTAKVILFAAGMVLALTYTWARLALVAGVFFEVQARRAAKRALADELAKANMTAAERELVTMTVSEALLAMGLASKGTEPVPPELMRWAKLPVLIGGRPVKGEWRYTCLIEPAAGRSITELIAVTGRGLDADDDKLRDTVNSQMRHAGGRDVAKLRKQGLVPPPFVLSTIEHVTRRGEKIGLGRLTLWTTDPFRKPVAFPYDPAKPRVRRFTDPVPVGLHRSNVEALWSLDLHTIVQGMNGSGKSSVIRPALVAAAHTDAIIICLALKGGNDYIDLRKRFAGGVIVTDLRQAANVLRWAQVEILRRNGLPAGELARLPHILLLGDELQRLGAEVTLAVPIVKEGRSAKVWMLAATQYAPSSVKPEDGGMPTTLLREFGQRFAGRIEGNHSQAQVAAGSRVTKTAGPHLIPGGKGWRGVIFGDDGRYLRAYWVSCDSTPKRPSMMARLAAACPTRPDDPPGFLEALAAPSPAVALAAPIEAPVWPQDGAERTADGRARALTVELVPACVRDALAVVWPGSGKQDPPAGRYTAAIVSKATAGAAGQIGRAHV